MKELYDANRADGSGRDEADKVGCSQVIKDLGYVLKRLKVVHI